MRTAGLVLVSIVFALCCRPTRLWGDIYTYQDESGVVCFSNVPVDARFRFRMKEKEAPRVILRAPVGERGLKRYDGLIEEAARENGLDPHLVRAVVEVESNYNPAAVSPKGAAGLMQLMPDTAKRFGLLDVFQPAENLMTGARYLRQLIDKYSGELRLALAAYNAGEGAVDQFQEIPPYAETQNYVREVIQRYQKKLTIK